jgi:lipid A disaccharide synthetase
LKIAIYTAEQLEGVDNLVQNEVICKFLGHPIVREIVLAFLQDLGVVQRKHEMIRNMKTGISMHLAGSRKSHLVMAKDIICTLASSENITSSRSIANGWE